MKRLFLIILVILSVSLTISWPVQAASEDATNLKELNFVFLHGYNGNSGAMQLLEDSIVDQLPAYILNYEYDHPEVKVVTDTLNRCYPNNVDIETWAQNIADTINERFAGKKNLVLIGHSMGGKTALYAVAHNIGGLADKVAMVVTINSPIKSLMNSYYFTGDTALSYWGAGLVMSDKGALESLINYDSSQDGKWVSENKHWLAFISCESNPLSSQFDTGGVDPLPRVMDDIIVPISFQYADGADVFYYGEYEHGDFSKMKVVADNLTEQILRYIFGGNIGFSAFARGGSFEHKAGLFPVNYQWQDRVGDVLAASGTFTHKNNSYFKWQGWEDTVGENFNDSIRSSFQITQKNSFPLFTGVNQSSWASTDNPHDGRISLSTRCAPGSSIKVEWTIYQKGLLPEGVERDRFEVDIETGTQYASIKQVSWETNDLRDIRLRILSEAQGPFRWFRAQWRVYYKASLQRQVIDEFPNESMSK